MRTKWVDIFIAALRQEGVPCQVLKRVNGWPETALIVGRFCFTKSITFNQARGQYFQGVDPGKLKESGDLVGLVCSKLRPNGYLFFGKTIIMSDEKDWTLGFEPVAQFLPSARFKSGNNLVQ